MNQTILITGTSSGLGLAFLKWFIAHPPTPQQRLHIIALDTRPFPADLLHLVQGDGNKVQVDIYQGDLTSPQFISDLAAQQLHNLPIHLVIHCAGIRGLVPSVVERQRGHVAAAEMLGVMDHATMMRTFEVNTWGTFNLIRSVLPNLHLATVTTAAAAAAYNGTLASTKPPTVVILSSRMGSVASNSAGGAYAYRASKAALNAVVKSFSVDVPEVAFSLLHPGRVETGLVEWKEEGAISVEESLRDCLKVINELRLVDSGKLFDRFGAEIPW